MQTVIEKTNRELTYQGRWAYAYAWNTFTKSGIGDKLDIIKADILSMQVKGDFDGQSFFVIEGSNDGEDFFPLSLNKRIPQTVTEIRNEGIFELPKHIRFIRPVLKRTSDEHDVNINVTIFAKGN